MRMQKPRTALRSGRSTAAGGARAGRAARVRCRVRARRRHAVMRHASAGSARSSAGSCREATRSSPPAEPRAPIRRFSTAVLYSRRVTWRITDTLDTISGVTSYPKTKTKICIIVKVLHENHIIVSIWIVASYIKIGILIYKANRNGS